ncbi:MAG: Ig-like domain-containing protein [Thermoplasmata archaeon]
MNGNASRTEALSGSGPPLELNAPGGFRYNPPRPAPQTTHPFPYSSFHAHAPALVCVILLILLLLFPLPSHATAASPDGSRAGSPELYIAITFPANGSVVGGEVCVTGEASGPQGAALVVQVSIDGGPWSAAAGNRSWSWVWSTFASGDGEHVLRARVSDGTAEAFAEIRVIVDNTPPPARISSALPAFGRTDAIEGELIEFAVTLEGGSGAEAVLWLVDGELWAAGKGNLSFCHSFPPGSAGNHSVEARVVRGDETLDLRLWSVEVRPPNRPPSVISHRPREFNLSCGEGEALNFSIEALDPDGEALGFSWSLDGLPVGEDEPWAIIKIESAGEHVVEVIVSDGNATALQRWNVTAVALRGVGIIDLVPLAVYFIAAAAAGVVYGRRKRGEVSPPKRWAPGELKECGNSEESGYAPARNDGRS